jgi:hypothetical protein
MPMHQFIGVSQASMMPTGKTLGEKIWIYMFGTEALRSRLLALRPGGYPDDHAVCFQWSNAVEA